MTERLHLTRRAVGRDWDACFRIEVFNAIEEAIELIEGLRAQAAVVKREPTFLGALWLRLRWGGR